MGPLVSILIPAYNSEKCIKETIESALNETWPRKEIIIVDDGSSDNTLQIASSFESKSVKVMTQGNRGASAARNMALEFAQGDYIQWLDADDLLEPDKISLQLKEAEAVSDTRTLLSSPFGEFYYCLKRAKFAPTPLWRDLSPVEWLLAKFSENVWMTNSSWLISRALTETAGPWNERLTLDDDGEYICRVVAASERVRFIGEAKSYYRQWNANSISRAASERDCGSLFLSLSLSIQYLRSLEDSERTRAACVKYLQTWYDYFYPERLEFVKKVNNLAKELGGTLFPPALGWKYRGIRKIFGWAVAKQVRRRVAAAKLWGFMNWDRLISKAACQSSGPALAK